jgi:hypothetical protein
VAITDTAVSDNRALGGNGVNSVGGAQQGGSNGGGGGGGLALYANATLTRVSVVGNVVNGGTVGPNPSDTINAAGGGLLADEALTTIEQSTFRANNAVSYTDGGYGGAISTGSFGAPAQVTTLVNSTVVDNEAGSSSGGVDSEATLTLSGDTLDGNEWDNLYEQADAAKVGDTIIADPVGTDAVNCVGAVGGTIADLTASGGNLEDDAASSCGFSASTGDKVGLNPELGPLQANGGAEDTMLPNPGSPVIGAGGACEDPTHTPAVPLIEDERGLPRPSGGPCDIGAVQIQGVENSVAPTVAPDPAIAGSRATCQTGGWSGDGLGGLTFAIQWLSGATVVASGTGYTPPSSEAGAKLSCRVTATSPYGRTSAPATSAAVDVLPPAPVISRFKQSHSRWRERGRAGRHLPPIGTTIRFTLSAPGTVTLTFTRRITGRLNTHGACVAQTAHNRRRRACTLTLTRTVRLSGHVGANTFRFTGRIAGHGSLPPGTYTVTASAASASGRGPASRRLRFTIVT